VNNKKKKQSKGNVKKKPKIQTKNVKIIRKSKPPSELRTIKGNFNQLAVNDEDILEILFDAIRRCHSLYTHVSFFIRLFVLNKYHNNDKIPIIDDKFIKMVFKCLTKDSTQGRPPSKKSKIILDELNEFYEKYYKKLNYKEKINGSNLSYIIKELITDMTTNIKNNIQLHFINRVRQFVNQSFKEEIEEKVNKCHKREKVKLRKELKAQIKVVKNDIIRGTFKSDPSYHNWIKEHRENVFPEITRKTFEDDIKKGPQKYIPCMIYMCEQIRLLDGKKFQFFPLRTESTHKYIPLDTCALIDLFSDNKAKDLKNIESVKLSIWRKVFNIDHKIFSLTEDYDNPKKYNFDFRILTDGQGISIQQIHKDYIKRKNLKKDKMKKARKKAAFEYADLDEDERIEIIEENNKRKEIKDDEYKKRQREYAKKAREKRKKMTEAEKELENKKKYIEFPYLEELNESEILELRKRNWLVIDPGKNVILYMKDKNEKIMRFSSRQYLTETKRIKYNRMNKNYKDKNGITDIESTLIGYDSKTCNFKEFMNYVKQKNYANSQLEEKYWDGIFRKYKWYGHINKKRCIDRLANSIKEKFEDNVVLIYGDWSFGKHMRGIVPVPGIGLKRGLAKHFTIFNIDEHRTSMINCKTYKKNKNLYLPDKKNVMREMHSILTYQMENNRKGCINRDKNAVNNMITIVNSFLKDRSRPKVFRREKLIDNHTIGEIKSGKSGASKSKVKKPEKNATLKYPSKKRGIKVTNKSNVKVISTKRHKWMTFKGLLLY
jgi:hypothetical protein